MTTIGLWTKAILSMIGAALGAALVALQDGHIESFEWVTIVVGALAALTVISFIRNATSGVLYYARAGTAAVIACLTAVGTGLADGQGLTANELIVAALALITALPVSIAPDAKDSDPETRGARRALVE